MPRSFGKPTDRNPDRLREWIERVYVQKSFYLDDQDGSERRDAESGDVVEHSNLQDGIAVIPLSDIFGQNTPLLKLSPSPVNEKYNKYDEKAVLQEAKVGTNVSIESEAICDEGADAAKDLIADWDPFGVSQEKCSDVVDDEKKESLFDGAYEGGVEVAFNVSGTVVPDKAASNTRHEDFWDPFKTSNNNNSDSNREIEINETMSKDNVSVEKEYQEILDSLLGMGKPEESKGLAVPERKISDESHASPEVKPSPVLETIKREIPLVRAHLPAMMEMK